MSHHPERKEKNCLNCGTIVQGKYCHNCGQENIEPKESFWDLVKHFFYDITHFDGKFFHSIRYLVTKPGFLPREYVLGRRATYLNPVRMYIFTSAFFFLLFFTFFHRDTDLIRYDINGKTPEQIEAMDSAHFANFTAKLNKEDGKPGVPMTREGFRTYLDTNGMKGQIRFTPGEYTSKEEYDSLLKAGVKKHNWFERKLVYKQIELNEKYNHNGKMFVKAFTSTLIHSIPQILFISLPLMALLLKLLYMRRKEFFYVSHALFSIYFYIFIFMALLVIFAVSEINTHLHSGILRWIVGLTWVSIFVYEYAALYKFYGQGAVKTFFKFLLLNILWAIVLGILFLFFVFFSLFKI